jgi:hypothetical protein
MDNPPKSPFRKGGLKNAVPNLLLVEGTYLQPKIGFAIGSSHFPKEKPEPLGGKTGFCLGTTQIRAFRGVGLHETIVGK